MSRSLKLAGFEVIWEKDLALDSPVSWYLPLDTSWFSITSFHLTAFGRFITRTMVKTLEYVCLAPEGSHRVLSFLEKAAERDIYTNIIAPLPIGFVVFLVNLDTIPITSTGINPARSLGAAIIYNKKHAWNDHWIFWVGPFIGVALPSMYHTVVIRAIPFKRRS